MENQVQNGRVEDGLIHLRLNENDNAVIVFNPADPLFMGKLYDLFAKLEEMEEKRKQAKKSAEGGKVFDVLRQADREMRSLLDSVLGAGLCDALFPHVGVYAMADGLPVWQNLIFFILDKMDDTVIAEQAKTNPRIEKYTKRYQKYKR